MASITIRKLDEDLKRRLRMRAASRNHSMEDEVRDILRAALSQQPQESLFDAMRKRSAPLGGFELSLPPRGLASRRSSQEGT